MGADFKYLNILLAIVILDSALIMAYSLLQTYIKPYNDFYYYFLYPYFVVGNPSWALYGIALFLIAMACYKLEKARGGLIWLIIFQGLIFLFASPSTGCAAIHFLEVAIGIISIQDQINRDLYKSLEKKEEKKE